MSNEIPAERWVVDWDNWDPKNANSNAALAKYIQDLYNKSNAATTAS
jgi:hypothetical protein